jgi:hypothetical protein
VCQSIFEKDKLLFTFLLAFRILEGEKCLDEKLFEFFLRGQQQNKDEKEAANEYGQSRSNIDDEDDEEDEISEEQKAKKKRD